jgi:hypothetical protein
VPPKNKTKQKNYINPSTSEAKKRGLQFGVGLGKKLVRSYLKEQAGCGGSPMQSKEEMEAEES